MINRIQIHSLFFSCDLSSSSLFVFLFHFFLNFFAYPFLDGFQVQLLVFGCCTTTSGSGTSFFSLFF